MSKAPAFQMYCNDWLASPTVMAMDPLEELAFFRILLFMWQDDECGLVWDADRMAKLTRTNVNTCSIVLEQCLSEHPTNPNKVTNKRLFEEWNKRQEFVKSRSEAGKRSAESRRKSKAAKDKEHSSTRVESSSNTAAANVNSSSSSSSSSSVVKKRGKESSVELPPAEAGPPPCPAQRIVDSFNATFGTNSRLTAKRKKQLSARWRDPHWRESWEQALERAGPSAFLRGSNDRSWVIDLEFFLRPDSVTKILEGKYDNRTGQQSRLTGHRAQQAEDANAAAFAALKFEDDDHDTGPPLFDEEPGTVHATQGGNLGRHIEHLPGQGG